MLNVKNVITAVLSSIVILSVNANEIVLDSFDYDPNISIAVDGDTDSVLNLLSPPVVTPLDVATASTQTTNSLIAANVDYTLSLVSDSDDVGDNLSISSANSGGGTLVYSESAGIQSTLELSYSGVGGTLLNISNFTGFYLDVVSGVEGFSLDLAFTDINTSEGSIFVDGNSQDLSGDRIVIDFTELEDVVDLSVLTSVSATISSPGLFADLIITEIGLVNVSEPTTLAIFALILLGFGVHRRNV